MIMIKLTYFFLSATALVVLFSCGENSSDTGAAFQLHEVTSPANQSSGEPNLYTDETGTVFLSWIEGEDEHFLRFAEYRDQNWSAAKTIVSGTNWFVNWADFPSLVSSKNLMAAHWLVKSGEGTYAYNVNIALSHDRGQNWGKIIVPHRDGTETEHGFVSMLPWQNGILAVWLDGRRFAVLEGAEPTHEMSLRAAVIDSDGRLLHENLVDERICDCCPTSSVLVAKKALVVYRDRSEGEIRDISIVKYEDDSWSAPRTIHDDNWEIKGCPVNGPAIDANSEKVAVAWFTMANETPRVNVVFSQDGGESFGSAIGVDNGNPLGRVDVLMLQSAALVSWIETTPDGGAEIRIRRIAADGTRSPGLTITKANGSRASGFPRMARNQDEIIFAWTEATKPAQVRTAVVMINEL